MKISDAAGNTLDLPRPASICRQCLTDAACWHSGHGIIAVHCAHANAAASWSAANRSWVLTSPLERSAFVALVAARIAQHAVEQAAAPGTRH